MKRIGFVGLGMMGMPMAATLRSKGFEVVANDIREEPMRAWAATGGETAERLDDLVGTDAVVVMVNTDAQAREVITHLIEVLRHQPSPLVCMSTVLPKTIRDLGKMSARTDIGLLDAPVSGGPILARFGALSIMVGGKRTLFDAVRPLLDAMGNSVTHVGPLGAGLTLKLVNNMIAINTLPLVLEALYIGLHEGLALDTMVRVIQASSGNTWLTENWEQAQLFLRFVAQDPQRLEPLLQTGRKDLQLVLTMCEQSGMDVPLLAHAIHGLEEQGSARLLANAQEILRHLAMS